MVTKRKKKRGSTISVNFEGVESGGRSVPDGTYAVEVEAVNLEEGEDSGKEYLKWEMRITKGKHKGVKLYDNTSLQPQALWKLKSLLIAMGEEVPDSTMELNPQDYVGKTLEVETTNEEYQGKDKSKITGYVGGESEEEEDGEEEEESEEEETEEESEEEEEEDDDEEEEEEEEEKPARGKGKRAQARAAAKKKSASKDDEDDEDEDEEEEEEEEEAPAKSSKKKTSAAKFKKGDKVKFKEDGKLYKGKVLEVDGSVATVDVAGDEWQVQMEDLSAL
jgi:hypothetical protein